MCPNMVFPKMPTLRRKECEYRSVVLNFIPSSGHTGENIAMIFHECLVTYDIIGKIHGITVDNATANTKFMYELAKQLPHLDSDNQHFQRFAHILNLGLEDLVLKNLSLHCETATITQEEQYEDYEDETEKDEEYTPKIADSRTAIIKLCSKIKRSEILKRKFQSACEAAGVPSNLNSI